MKFKNNARMFWEKHRIAIVISYFLIYLLWFKYIESLVTTHFHIIHMPLDDLIPFCEYFIVPYILWFAYIACGAIYFFFHDHDDFYRLCIFLATGMTVFLIISTFYPNGHYLRPYHFTRNNVFIDLCKMIYGSDTPTNLFPSIHVYNSIGIHIAVQKCKGFKHPKLVKTLSGILATSIILSTMFVKQHSVFDVVCAFILAIIMYQIVYVSNLVVDSAGAPAYARSVGVTASYSRKQKKSLPQH